MTLTKTIHCYLIDDDPDEIEIFLLALGELDLPVECTPFMHCQEALDALLRDNSHPDCIFMDLFMGPTSGKECLELITSTELISHIPTVILSGSEDTIGFEKLGAQTFIKKSSTIGELALQLKDYFTSYFDVNNDLGI